MKIKNTVVHKKFFAATGSKEGLRVKQQQQSYIKQILCILITISDIVAETRLDNACLK